jgi:exodeoxyribonuclease V gamma subunit
MNEGPGLHLFTSNRLEALADALGDNIQSYAGPPLASETIMVQSKGMQKWLSLTLASKLGICANCEFPFPNSLVQQFFSLIPENRNGSPLFQREVLCFRILQLLPDLFHLPVFSPLENYLGKETSSLKSFQLARHLANLFDQYTIYRPDMLLDWDQGGEGGWQAELWRKIGFSSSVPHRASLQRKFLSLCRNGAVEDDKIPNKISIFGVSTLPLFHIEMLAAAAKFSSVHLYLLNPSREYWFDIISTKAGARKEVQALPPGVPSFDVLHYETGHPLLASLGTTGSEFFGMLFDHCDFQEHSLFEAPEEKNLLSTLQVDIHLCRNHNGSEKVHIHPRDDSLQIHSCHTPLREMEVLRDFILSCFENIPGLLASEILVMTPDIEKYAPYITAVFDSLEDATQKITYTIADRSHCECNRIARYFFDILALRKSRFEVSRIIDLLQSPEIQKRFDIQGQDLELLCHWLAETRIRWGISSEDRAARGLPDYPENSWKAGLDRLLLGYALPGDGEHLFKGILPYDDMEGNSTLLLGKFAEFITVLSDAVPAMEKMVSLQSWVDWLKSLLEGFFLPEIDSEGEFLEVESALHELSRAGELGDFDQTIDIDSIEAFLMEKLTGPSTASGRFLSGGVTFCAMLPMRSIPFRIIAIAGLNDGVFPRRATPLNFDLMADAPRRGDRSLRHEDRYLFLETLISARDKLFISYLGQNTRDNSQIPPSVVVSEMLDYLESNYAIVDSAATVTDHVLFRHPLQAFDPLYFQKGSRLNSYSSENLAALLSACNVTRIETSPMAPLPIPEEEWKNIELSQFLTFFRHPARYFLRKRLGVFPEENSAVLEDREPFFLKGLERYELGNFLTENVLKDENPEENYPVIRERGILPHGVLGKMAFNELTSEAGSLAVRVRNATEGEAETVIDVSGKVEDFHLSGRVAGIYGDTLVRYRFARNKAVDQLKVWLELAVLKAFLGTEAPVRSVVIGTDGGWEYGLHPESEQILRELLQLYWRGLTLPLAFFPETSLSFVRALKRTPDDPEKALEAARKIWEADPFRRGESEDPYYELCFQDGDPLNEEFQSLASLIYQPMLAFQKGL